MSQNNTPKPQALSDLFFQALKQYIRVLPRSIVPVTMVVCMSVLCSVVTIPQHVVLQVAFYVITIAVLLYAWTILLLVAHASLNRQTLSVYAQWRQALRALPGMMFLMLFFLCSIAIALALMVVMQHQLSQTAASGQQAAFFVASVAGFFVMFTFIYGVLTWTDVVIEQRRPWVAIYRSMRVMSAKWVYLIRGFVIYAGVGISFFAVYHQTFHYQRLAAYHMAIPFSFLVLVMVLPLMSLLMVLIHQDMALRVRFNLVQQNQRSDEGGNS